MKVKLQTLEGFLILFSEQMSCLIAKYPILALSEFFPRKVHLKSFHVYSNVMNVVYASISVHAE